MFVIAVSAVVAISFLAIPRHLSQDGWLALVAGRTVAAHGIPQHDYFTHMSYGARWVDQQWLAQLLMYEVQRLGGLQLADCSLRASSRWLAFAATIAAARDLLGEDLHVLMATVPGAFFYLVTAISIRTQGLAYPLFVATLWLLASEVRSPVRRRRVYLVFPMLVLWGNLHGSVTLGAGLAVLYGLALLIDDLRGGGRSLADARAWAFIVLAPLTLLATPYGGGMIHYYRVTLLNSRFSQMVTEWEPVTSVPVLAIPLFVLIAITAVAVARALRRPDTPRVWSPVRKLPDGRRPPLFDVLTLVACWRSVRSWPSAT